jgi:Fe2+ or Zn2+ uptake regulation protein
MTEELYFYIDGRRISFTSLQSYIEESQNFNTQEKEVLSILSSNNEPMTSRMIHLDLTADGDVKILTSSVARAVNSLKKKGYVVVKKIGPCHVSGKSAHFVFFPENENDRGLRGYLDEVDDELNEAERSRLVEESEDDAPFVVPGFDITAPIRQDLHKYKILSFDWMESEGKRERDLRRSFYKRKFHIVDRPKLSDGKQANNTHMTKAEYWKRVGIMDWILKLASVMTEKGMDPAQLIELLYHLPSEKKSEQGNLFSFAPILLITFFDIGMFCLFLAGVFMLIGFYLMYADGKKRT